MMLILPERSQFQRKTILMKNQASSRLLIVLSVVAIAGVTALIALRPKAPLGRNVEVISGIDTSDSEREKDASGGSRLGRGIALLAKLGARLDQNRDHLTVFRVDREAREFYDQLAPKSREKFQWRLISETQTPAQQSGTLPYKFWTEAAKRADQSESPVAVCLFSNGDCDDLSDAAHAELRQAAQKLAQNPRVVSVRIYGAESKNWASIKEDFAPLGDRLQVQNPGDMDAEPLLSELEEARHDHDETRLAQADASN